ncbi:cytochrome oxidase assembly protein 1 [Coemansia sp. RSA 1813]|nr:cytochrome oxidase assembly protein 1 [Coemansia sp. RSA 1646]KAJ1768506.1 cytochrome oxidase assembly protein 1 [Coemansia sp. RSA 1843]KAJ2093024.1 cytochrome oxidase assembly protein 1 [Coemansia sp. RSA 986]KAJ2214068.1 cytochrome oxidase assembly protein 1 [Coemansia sp. RSA 487]KAJ2569132.1 cytochrome oxidase assembly protein 1 [Coemansia sp. RSA 1813]
MNPLTTPLSFRRILAGSPGRLLLCRSTRHGGRYMRASTAYMSTQGAAAAAANVQQTWEAANAKNPAFAVERELPLPKSHKREIAIFVVVAAVTWGLGSVVAFNYQRMTSTPVTAALFTARHNEKVREVLGSQLNFTSAFPWISGDISHLKGVVDFEFDVTGSKGVVGRLVLKSRRLSSSQNGEWKTIEFYVEMPDGRRIDCN